MSGDPFSSIGSSVVSANFKKRKSRFTFSEVQLLLTEVKRNRHILVGQYDYSFSNLVKHQWHFFTIFDVLGVRIEPCPSPCMTNTVPWIYVLQTGKFNQGVSSDVKKRTWAALTARINEISECHREVIEIVKKWSDLKCDTKRKVAAMRASGFSAARITDDLSPVERMVHQILQAGPGEKFPVSDSIADEDEDSQGASAIPLHIPGTANGRLPIKPQVLPHHSGMSSKGDTDLPLDIPCSCKCIL